MNIKQIKNILREFQAENRWKFKNAQAEFKKAVSYIKKKCISCHSGAPGAVGTMRIDERSW